MIKLKITKFDKNEKYDEQLEQYERATKNVWRTKYDDPSPSRPYPDVVDTILEVEITEEQWSAIRKSVLEIF